MMGFHQVMVVKVMNTKLHSHTPQNVSFLSSFTASSLEYGAVDSILRFAACEMRSCVYAFIMDDIILENGESFILTLERTPDLDSRITLDPVNGVVEITENDGRYSDYSVKHT